MVLASKQKFVMTGTCKPMVFTILSLVLLVMTGVSSAWAQTAVYQVNSGGSAVSPFVADKDFSGGQTASTTSTVSTSGVANAAPAKVYQTERWGGDSNSNPTSFSYTFPSLTAGASYTVRLHFAEIYWTKAGQRKFNVAINGTTVLSNFDILATAGGANKAVVEQFTATANSSGKIVISYTVGSADAPKSSGIEIISKAGATPTPTPLPTPTPTAKPTATPTAKPTATPTPTPTATPTATPVTTKVFAPFEYVGDLSDANQLSGVLTGSGVKAVVLAFLVPSNNGCNLAWPGANGNLPNDTIGSTSMGSVISEFQAKGVTIAISQGGAGGQEAAGHCSTAAATQAVYQQLITQYHINWLDFDIEWTETSGQSTRRAAALAALQKANPGLMISYTLPADTPGDGVPNGLDSGSNGGITDITDAIAAGVNLTIINGMTMDFGNTTTDQATLTEQTAAAIESWIKSQGINSKVGLTVLPGTSDTSGAVFFTLNDATTVVNFANANSYVQMLSFWELNRDNGGCPGSSSDQDTCSGLTQSTWELSGIFNKF